MILRPSVFEIPAFIYGDQWAEENVILKDTGRFKFDVTPFFKEPTKYATDLATTCRVILKTPAQVGKSQMIMNVIGWMSCYDASNSLIILDSLKTGQRMSKNRLKPFLRDTCGIAAFDKTQKDRSKATTNLSLGSGANLIIGSANSASDLCSTPVKWLFCDELDRWADELDGEGDPLLLAFKRQMRFRGMALLTSTPTVESGRINQHYLLGTQQTWCAQCDCGELMRVSYDDIIWDDIPYYSCEKCGQVWHERDIKSLPHMYTEPKNKTPYVDKFGRVARSFEVTATLCHNQYTWDALRKEEMQARALGEASIRSFRNTALGEVYTPPEQEAFAPGALCKLASLYTDQSLPSFVETLVCGIDTQDHGFPYVIMGFAKNMKKACFVKASVIIGEMLDHSTWGSLKDMLNKFAAQTKDGRCLKISLAAIDTGGHFTQDVYALSMLSHRIRAVKGGSKKGAENSIISHVTRVKVKAVGTGIGSTDLTIVNTKFCKDFIHTRLSEKMHGDQSLWMWTNDPGAGLDENFFSQLTSEIKTYSSNGEYKWEKLPNRENHYLDATVYALAAMESLRLASGNIPAIDAVEDDVKDDVKDDIKEEKSREFPTHEKREFVPVKRKIKPL